MAYFDNSPFDIAVIGGGYSGMWAAATAAERARAFGVPAPRVVLFEAGSRLGGRAIGGAEWLHPDEKGENPIHTVACSRFNVSPKSFHYDAGSNVISITDDGIYYNQEFNRHSFRFIDSRYQAFRKKFPDEPVSLGRIASDDPIAGLYAELKARTWVGVDDPYDVPVEELVSDKYESGGYQHEDGMETAIIEPLEKELVDRGVSIHTNRRIVTVIRMDDNQWALLDDKGRPYLADNVIVAVPPHVLKRRQIEFLPALSPDTTDYADQLITSSLTKVVVPLEYPVSRQAFVRINFLQNGARYFAHIRNVGNNKAVTFFTGGRQAREMESLSENRMRLFIRNAFNEIGRLKGWEDFNELRAGQYEVSQWNKRGGTYTACSLGMQRSGVIEDKRSGVILCGDAFAKEGPSTLVGARSTGIEAGAIAADSYISPFLPFVSQRARQGLHISPP